MGVRFCRHGMCPVDRVERRLSSVGTDDDALINADVVAAKRHEIGFFAGMRGIHPEHRQRGEAKQDSSHQYGVGAPSTQQAF